MEPGANAVSGSGGQRYFVEVSPWDQGDGSYYSLALSWAGLSNYVLSDYAAQGWNYIYPSYGKASAFGAADIISPWIRRQAWREWSKWTFDFSPLLAAGLKFKILAWQAECALSGGLRQADPVVENQFSTELFPRAGYCAMPPPEQPDSEGVLELEIGGSSGIPEIPSAPAAGSKVKGWSLKSAGPFIGKFDFKFKKA